MLEGGTPSEGDTQIRFSGSRLAGEVGNFELGARAGVDLSRQASPRRLKEGRAIMTGRAAGTR